jgi:hypothetical protein
MGAAEEAAATHQANHVGYGGTDLVESRGTPDLIRAAREGRGVMAHLHTSISFGLQRMLLVAESHPLQQLSRVVMCDPTSGDNSERAQDGRSIGERDGLADKGRAWMMKPISKM